MDLSKEPKYNKHDYAIFESIKATFSDENLIDFTKKSTLNIVEIGCGKELHYTGLVLWNLALCGFKNINLWLIEPLADSGEQNLRYLKDCFPDCNFHRVYSDWQSFQSRNLIEYSDITYTIQVTTTIPDQKLKNLIKNHRNRMHSKSLIIDISETNEAVEKLFSKLICSSYQKAIENQQSQPLSKFQNKQGEVNHDITA
jgi:hypothetical protein